MLFGQSMTLPSMGIIVAAIIFIFILTKKCLKSFGLFAKYNLLAGFINIIKI